MNEKKNKGDNPVPQFTPFMQSGEVFIVSYIIVGQSSPVTHLKRIIIAIPKLLKFIYSFIYTPSVISPNIFTPKTA